jgi:hypothetical protein
MHTFHTYQKSRGLSTICILSYLHLLFRRGNIYTCVNTIFFKLELFLLQFLVKYSVRFDVVKWILFHAIEVFVLIVKKCHDVLEVVFAMTCFFSSHINCKYVKVLNVLNESLINSFQHLHGMPVEQMAVIIQQAFYLCPWWLLFLYITANTEVKIRNSTDRSVVCESHMSYNGVDGVGKKTIAWCQAPTALKHVTPSTVNVMCYFECWCLSAGFYGICRQGWLTAALSTTADMDVFTFLKESTFCVKISCSFRGQPSQISPHCNYIRCIFSYHVLAVIRSWT